MLKETKTVKTKTYEVDSEYYKDFMVDIVDIGEMREVWLYHKSIGIKELMFGLSKDHTTATEIIDIVKNNLLYETYIENYLKEYVFAEFRD